LHLVATIVLQFTSLKQIGFKPQSIKCLEISMALDDCVASGLVC